VDEPFLLGEDLTNSGWSREKEVGKKTANAQVTGKIRGANGAGEGEKGGKGRTSVLGGKRTGGGILTNS